MSEDILGFIGIFLVSLMIVIGMVATIIFISLSIYKYDCSKLSEQVGYSTEYHFWGGGCLLDIDGKMIPRSKWINNTGN